MSKPTNPKDEQTLFSEIWSDDLKYDLVKFVQFVFPWGKPNTPLANMHGPRDWQLDELTQVTAHIKKNLYLHDSKQTPLVYKSAIASGRGVGKSALEAWLAWWMISTNPGSTVVVSANSEDQLKTKTFAELGIWHTLAINGHWFDRTVTHVQPAGWYQKILKEQLSVDSTYHYIHAQLWSAEKPDAYAGAHNQQGIMVLFDEASGIPKPIWGVTKGFFFDNILHRYHFAFSNPRLNTGEFFECFHKNRDEWHNRHIDVRTIKELDPAEANSIVKKEGLDSDTARIEVLGQFPNQGDRQFISRNIIQEAVSRDIPRDNEWSPLYMGVDVARFGDDSTVIFFRKGRDARSIPFIRLKGRDNMEIANLCGDLILKYEPDAVCIDAGNGTGVIDRLREMKFKVHEIWFGAKAENPEWADKRTEMWARIREWLPGSCLPLNQHLQDDLAGPQYEFVRGDDKIKLESKEKMKQRGLSSPDIADALACTFFVKVMSKQGRQNSGGKQKMRVIDGAASPFFQY